MEVSATQVVTVSLEEAVEAGVVTTDSVVRAVVTTTSGLVVGAVLTITGVSIEGTVITITGASACNDCCIDRKGDRFGEGACVVTKSYNHALRILVP